MEGDKGVSGVLLPAWLSGSDDGVRVGDTGTKWGKNYTNPHTNEYMSELVKVE